MVFGVIISAALFIFDGFFLSLLDVPADIWAEASLFLRYIGLFIVVQSAYISFISFFRGYSLLKITMITSVVMNLINIAGNCILIHGLGPIPSLGVLGVTISTNTSKVLGLLLILLISAFRLNTCAPSPKARCIKFCTWGCPPAANRFPTRFRRWLLCALLT